MNNWYHAIHLNAYFLHFKGQNKAVPQAAENKRVMQEDIYG